MLDAARNEPNKRLHISLVRHFQIPIVVESLLLLDYDRRVARLHENEIHEDPSAPPVAIIERMDVDELVVGQGGHLNGMRLLQQLFRVEPLDELGHEDWHVSWSWRHKAADKHLMLAELARLDWVAEAQNSPVS